jgi:hypothetical protein
VRVSGSGDPRDASPATLAVLSEEMRWRLYALVRAAHRPVSREEAAASTGISRKLAAFHLDKLVSAGLLRARYDAPLGPRRVGRTPKTYEPSGVDISITIPARHYDVLAGILIDAVRAGASGEDPQSAAAGGPDRAAPAQLPVPPAFCPRPGRGLQGQSGLPERAAGRAGRHQRQGRSRSRPGHLLRQAHRHPALKHSPAPCAEKLTGILRRNGQSAQARSMASPAAAAPPKSSLTLTTRRPRAARMDAARMER